GEILYCLVAKLDSYSRKTSTNMSATQSLPCADWREIYLLAIRETDRGKLSLRIAEAQQQIVARARELFNVPAHNIDEAQALEDSLYALQALKNCLTFRTN